MVNEPMYKIIEARELTANIYLMAVEAPRVAKNCQPGQFVIVRTDKDGERIPLTICDYDREKGTITIVFQTVGAETTRMAELKAGDAFHDFVGPLGCASELIQEDKAVLAKKKISGYMSDGEKEEYRRLIRELSSLLPEDDIAVEEAAFMSVDEILGNKE